MDNPARMISFERVKTIMRENADTMVRTAKGDAGCGFAEWGFSAATLIGAMKSYVDGAPVRAHHIGKMLLDRARALIVGADVRCVGELLALLPKGRDKRLPGWLYDGVDAYLEDDGWVLVPKVA